MTDDYQTGRIYSGVIEDKRMTFLAGTLYGACVSDGVLRERELHEFTDVRGPLVVLDLPGVDVEYAVKMMRDCGCDTNAIAAQIEEQTRPPLQIGVHLARSHDGATEYMRWDGDNWYSAGAFSPSSLHWTSIRYIGPSSSDE